jgi:hypothetical protein
MAQTPGTPRQTPDQSILDLYNKQTYLGNSFLVSTNFVASNTSETPLLYLNNPATNAKNNGDGGSLGLFNIVRKFQNDTLGSAVIFNIYLNPTGVTGGTSITPQNLRPAWGTVSKMTAKVSPAVVSNGTFISTTAPNFIEIDAALLFVLDPGQSLLITVSAASTSNSCAELVYYEI